MYLAKIEEEPMAIAREGRIRLSKPLKPTEGKSLSPTVKIKIKIRAVQNDGMETQIWLKTERPCHNFFFRFRAKTIPKKLPSATVNKRAKRERAAVVFKALAIREETFWLYL